MRNSRHSWIILVSARATRTTLFALTIIGAPAACATGVVGDFASKGDWEEDSGVESSLVDARPPSRVSDGGSDPGRGIDAAAAMDAANDGGPHSEAGGDADTEEADAGPSVLVGKWTFDEGSGTSSADLSGNGHRAVFAGGASWAASGKEGSGLALNGTTAYADVGVTLVDTTRSFSVFAWAKLAVVSNWEVLASQDDAVGSLFGLKLRGDNNQFDFDIETSDVTSPGFIAAQSGTVGTALTWVHLAGIYNSRGGGTLKLYVNGALRGTAPTVQNLLPSIGHFILGRGLYNGTTGSFLNGTLDEVEVYAGALTDAEVSSIFTSQQ